MLEELRAVREVTQPEMGFRRLADEVLALVFGKEQPREGFEAIHRGLVTPALDVAARRHFIGQNFGGLIDHAA